MSNEPITCAVINPASANGSTARKWPEIRRMLESRGVPCETRLTNGPGQAMAIARRALQEGVTRLIAVGGDGTINEIINGFMSGDKPVNPDASLGIIPRGTGCDFIRTLGIPHDVRQAVGVIAAGRERAIDLGRASFVNRAGAEEVRYFGNIAEVGLGGAVVERVNRTSKALGGFASFLIGTVVTFWKYRNKRVAVTLDDQPPREMRACNVVVANCQYFGGGMRILPMAQPDDGLLDVLLMKDLTRPELYANILKVYQGNHLDHPKLEALRARRVRVEALDEPVKLEIDGEEAGLAPAEFSLLPRTLKVLVP